MNGPFGEIGMSEAPAVRQFGPYDLITRLGVGGMAETWLALRRVAPGVHKFLALKCILPACNDVAEYVRLFYHEAGISLNLEHPNIISVWDCSVIDGRHTMVMEYLRGVTLREVFVRMRERKVKMPLEVASWIGVQILEALDYLHQYRDDAGEWLQIVHRDVTPDNIFVCYDGLCRLFDFGVARSGCIDNDIQRGMIVGKVAYMSPEQCEGGDVDGRSDTFALAAVLYEMATGMAVFERESDILTIQALMHDEIEAPHKRDYRFSAYLSRIIMQGLEREPARRYATAGEFAGDLRNYMKVGGFAQTPVALKRFLSELFAPEIERIASFLSRTLESVSACSTSMEQVMGASRRISESGMHHGVNRANMDISISKISSFGIGNTSVLPSSADTDIMFDDTSVSPIVTPELAESYDTMEMPEVRPHRKNF